MGLGVLLQFSGPCYIRWPLFCTVVLVLYGSPSSVQESSLVWKSSLVQESFFFTSVVLFSVRESFFFTEVLLRFGSLLLYGSPSSVYESSSVR